MSLWLNEDRRPARVDRVEIYEACGMSLDLVSTGMCGGDAGHGGRLRLRFGLAEMGATAGVVVDDDEYDAPMYVDVVVGGDAEISLMAQLLKHAVEKLEEWHGNGFCDPYIPEDLVESNEEIPEMGDVPEDFEDHVTEE